MANDTIATEEKKAAVEAYITSTANAIREEIKDLSNWQTNRQFRSLIRMGDRKKKGDEVDGSDSIPDESVQQEQSSGDSE